MAYWSFLFNICAALVMGMAIGAERQWRSHPAGLRTNTLVALGAALFVSLSALMDDTGSPTRIASYVVSGLGFLGGGDALVQRRDRRRWFSAPGTDGDRGRSRNSSGAAACRPVD